MSLPSSPPTSLSGGGVPPRWARAAGVGLGLVLLIPGSLGQQIQLETQRFRAGPGQSVNVNGTLINGRGGPLLITSGSLFLATQPLNPTWRLTFQEALLADDFLLPPEGYSGPLFTLVVPTNAPVAVFGHGWIELTVETPGSRDSAELIRQDFVLGQPPLDIRKSDADVELFWPRSARAFQLESAPAGAVVPVFVPVTNRVSAGADQLSIHFDPADPARLFRLTGPGVSP